MANWEDAPSKSSGGWEDAPVKAQTPAGFSAPNLGLAALSGFTGAAKSLTDVFGANNYVSRKLGEAEQYLEEAKTPERKAEIARRRQIEEEANKSGDYGKMASAYLGAVKEAPLETLAGLGGAVAPFIFGGGQSLAARAALTGIGAAMGAGSAKGAIYDSVYNASRAAGDSEEVARAKADKEQSYSEHPLGIATAAGLGIGSAVAGAAQTANAAIRKRLGQEVAEKAVDSYTKSAAKEATAMGAQSAQQQALQNQALTGAGYQTPIGQGVLGAGLTGAISGAAFGAGAKFLHPNVKEVQKTEGDIAPEIKPTDPLAKVDPNTSYADLHKELASLRSQEQTPEVQTRAALIADHIKDRDIAALQQERTQQQQEQADAQKAAGSAFTQPNQRILSRTEPETQASIQAAQPAGPRVQGDLFADQNLPTEAPPTTPLATVPPQTPQAPIAVQPNQYQYKAPLRNQIKPADLPVPQPLPTKTLGEMTIKPEDITNTGVEHGPGVARWMQDNIVGRTLPEVQDMVKKDPTLLSGKGQRTQVLKELLNPAPEVAPYKEAENVAKPVSESTGTSAVVASKPDTGAPAGGLKGIEPSGVASTEQPAGKPVVGEGPQPSALTPAAPRPVPMMRPAAKPIKPNAEPSTTTAAPAEAPAATTAPTVEEPATNTAPQTVTLRGGDREAGIRDRLQQVINDQTASKAQKRAAFEHMDNLDKTSTQTDDAHNGKMNLVEDYLNKYHPAEPTDEQRQSEAAKVQAALAEAQKPKAPEAAPRMAASETRAEPKEIPEKLREPIGVNDYFGVEEGKPEILRGDQGMLFMMTKAEEEAYARAKARGATDEEARTEAKATTPDERQGQLDFNAPIQEPKQEAHPKWATEHAEELKGNEIVYSDKDVALLRGFNGKGGHIYSRVSRIDGTRSNRDIESPSSFASSPEEKARLIEAKNADIQREKEKYAKNPDGPFKGAERNVITSESVDPRYGNYLHELMNSLGMGDIRVFISHPSDLHAMGAADKYGLHGEYQRAIPTGFNEQQLGRLQSLGEKNTDFQLSLKSGMSEQKTHEILAHELGHLIQHTAFDRAPKEVQNAIMDAHSDWVESVRGGTAKELISNLRNRVSGEDDLAGIPDTQKASEMEDPKYWLGFPEWFADNVSRWATTADKPLTIADKFFSKLAEKLRSLVAMVTGRKYPPNAMVAKFLDEMGPGSIDNWLKEKQGTNTPQAVVDMQQRTATQSVPTSIERDAAYLKPKETSAIGAVKSMYQGSKTALTGPKEIGTITKVRTQVTDAYASVKSRIQEAYDQGMMAKLGKADPRITVQQAKDTDRMLQPIFERGGLEINPVTRQLEVTDAAGKPKDILNHVKDYAAATGRDYETAYANASHILEGLRVADLIKQNATQGTEFVIHKGWRNADGSFNTAKIKDAETAYRNSPELQKINKIMDEFRIRLVDLMEKTGRLNEHDAKVWREVSHYVPFDREGKNIEAFAKTFTGSKRTGRKGLAQLGALPKLIGSYERSVGNVFESYYKTMGWMVDQVSKQNANSHMLDTLVDLSIGKNIGMNEANSQTGYTAPIYRKGVKEFVDLPSAYDALPFVDKAAPKRWYVAAMGKVAPVTRKFVTANPAFAAKQVFEDVQGALITSNVHNPARFIAESFGNFGRLTFHELKGYAGDLTGRTSKVHDIERQMRNMGLAGEVDYTSYNPGETMMYDMGIRTRGPVANLIHRLERITHGSDLAVRKALYDDEFRKSKDSLMATQKARELINFRNSGANTLMRDLVSVVPFLNSTAQSLDIMYRAATGVDAPSGLSRDAAKALFRKNMAIYAGMALAYAMAKSGDEEYEKMNRRMRDNNWVVGGGVRIPIRGDMAIAKVAIENAVGYFHRQGTPEEQLASEAVKTAMAYAWSQTGERVAAAPIPLAVRPLLEIVTNHSFLTGRELEGTYQQTLMPHERQNNATSFPAKALSNAIYEFTKGQFGLDISPIKIDQAVNGYFGAVPAVVNLLTDSMLNPGSVDRPMSKWMGISGYAYDESNLSNPVDEFYNLQERTLPVLKTLQDLTKRDPEKAMQFAQDHQQELALAKPVQHALSQLSKIRQYENILKSPRGAEIEPNMAERQRQLTELARTRNEMVGWVREAEKMVRQ